MKLMDGYRSFLTSLGHGFENDLLIEQESKKPVYFTYNKVRRRMALPTSAMIKAGMVDGEGAEVHAFHPLCEDVLRGESGTIRYLKRRIRYCFIMETFKLLNTIIALKVNKTPVRASKFTNFLASALDGVKDIRWDAKLKSSAEKATMSILSDDITHTNVYITNKKKVDGDMYLRVANLVTFMDELGEEGVDFFNAKLERKIDKVVIYRLLKAITEWIPAEVGSNDDCPYFGSLARMWHEYVRNYNTIARTINDVSDIKPIPQDWFIIIDEMPRYRNLIATLPYNTGPRSGTTEKSVPDSYSLDTSHKPQPEAVPRASETSSGTSIFDVLGRPKQEDVYADRLAELTPAEQDVAAGRARMSTTSVLDRRLVPEPPRHEPSVLERAGLSNRDHGLYRGLDDYHRPSGGLSDYENRSLGGLSRESRGLLDDLNHGRSGGLNTSFFR